MKLLLVLAAVLLGVWLWRSGRLKKKQDRQSDRPPASPDPVTMICCGQCGVHLPKAEAVEGKQGMYCSVQHQLSAES